MHYRKLSSSGLSPLTRPQDSLAQGLAIFGSSPPQQPLGASLLASMPADGNPATIPPPPLANHLPQTNNPTPKDTPELSAQKSSFDPNFYSSRGEHSDYHSLFGRLKLNLVPLVILTTYPNQAGIRPTPLKWYATDPQERGPVIASRHPNSIRIRNAIGASGGNYAVYRALAVA